ncbi:Ribokinase-like protein [Calycina marina]|uniref:ATP-dependent (S)-NAD(P)H-hydrate dehydratase n=1 Tax=Calycina marina TaxID=1763456 RepID=A0A9P7YYE1_9HELO|nr:Ribokinase-like protein [Calycina marina]
MPEESLMMSQATKDILRRVRKMVPPMLEKFHKGQMGRIAVIGGSEDYTGAPYFSAMASARLGADMSHVICEPQAAAVIKTYSPNLMVHPLMRQTSHATTSEPSSSIANSIIDMLPRLHVLVIGPGLGRDKLMQDTCAKVIEAARKQNMPFVLDADGLNLAQTQPELVQGYRECILTPNVVEFGRLCKSKGIDVSSTEVGKQAAMLSEAFGGVTIIQKGAKDYISNGDKTFVSDVEGGLKRSGGQGDTLTGSLATFLGWRKAYLDKLWDHEGDLDSLELLALAAFGGSALTRECSRLAFKKNGRSLQASDLTDEVHSAFLNLFDEPTPRL